jgi:hypothetical protein
MESNLDKYIELRSESETRRGGGYELGAVAK